MRLYFATDGLTEAENTAGQDFAAEKLLEAYDQHRHRPLDEGLTAVIAGAKEWGAPAQLADDVVMLAIEGDR